MGQDIFLPLEKDGKGGLRDLPMSRCPIPIGSMFKSTAGLPVSLEIKAGTNNSKIAELIDTPKGKLLVIAPKKSDPSQRFTGFGGADELEITILGYAGR